MGNGNLGLMIYQEPGTNSLRLETGSSEVHDHRPDCNIYGKGRLLTGHFNITPIGKIQKIRMRLDLWNAETTAHVTTSKGAFDLKAFVSATQMVICVMVTNQGQEKCTYSWIPAHADSPRIQYSKLPAGSWMKNLPSDYVPNPQPEITIKGHSGLSVQKLWAGGETAICWNEIPVDHGFVLLSCISRKWTRNQRRRKLLQFAAKRDWTLWKRSTNPGGTNITRRVSWLWMTRRKRNSTGSKCTSMALLQGGIAR